MTKNTVSWTTKDGLVKANLHVKQKQSNDSLILNLDAKQLLTKLKIIGEF